MLEILALLLCSINSLWSIPINNGVQEGYPDIQCGVDQITIYFKTQNPFSGRIFAKGYADDSECTVRAKSNGQTDAEITVSVDRCGVKRKREISPSPGLAMTAVIVISFHPTFLTKVDRAYRISCFYMEAQKTVQQELAVSMLVTASISQQVQMPSCRYEILSENAFGEPVRFAAIGEQVYHKWTCEADQEDVFCMRVHSCMVEDGQGGPQIMVINELGCGVDRYILRNIEYTNDLTAGQEAHVFKFADKAALNFNCQIELSLKNKDGGCAAVQPVCSADGRRQKRRTVKEDSIVVADFDLPEQTMVVFDIEDVQSKDSENALHHEEISPEDLTKILAENSRKLGQLEKSKSQGLPENPESAVCFQTTTFACLMTIFGLSIVSCLSVLVVLFLHRKRAFPIFEQTNTAETWSRSKH